MLDSLPSQHLPDICASIVKASYSEKIQVLDAVDLSERIRTTLPLLERQIEVGTSKTVCITNAFLIYPGRIKKIILTQYSETDRGGYNILKGQGPVLL